MVPFVPNTAPSGNRSNRMYLPPFIHDGDWDGHAERYGWEFPALRAPTISAMANRSHSADGRTGRSYNQSADVANNFSNFTVNQNGRSRIYGGRRIGPSIA